MNSDSSCTDFLANGSGWCGQSSIDIQGPAAGAAQTLRIWLEQPVIAGKGTQSSNAGAWLSVEPSQGCGAKASGSVMVVTIAQTASCRLVLTAATKAAGEYRSTVRVRDAAGALDQSSSLALKAGAPASSALFWVIVGGFLGAAIAYARDIFRPRAANLGDALRQVRHYEIAAALARQSRLVPSGGLALLDGEARQVLDDAKAGRPIPPTFAARAEALRSWAGLAQQARALEAAPLQPLRTKFAMALNTLITGTEPASGLAALEAALSEALSAQAQATLAPEAARDAQAAAAPVPVTDLSPILLDDVKSLKQLSRVTMALGLVETVADLRPVRGRRTSRPLGQQRCLGYGRRQDQCASGWRRRFSRHGRDQFAARRRNLMKSRAEIEAGRLRKWVCQSLSACLT